MLFRSPNTPVRFHCAIFPGFLAGTAFQFVQYFYINSQIWVSSYNAIYGSFAAIPMYMLWTQISWCICLFGAELTYANQNIEMFTFGKDVQNVSRRYHDFMCVWISSIICKRFEQLNKGGFTANEIASEHGIPLRLVCDVIYELQSIGILEELAHVDKGTLPRYNPSGDINQLSVGVLMDRIARAGSENFKRDRAMNYADTWKVLQKAQRNYLSELDKVLLKDL